MSSGEFPINISAPVYGIDDLEAKQELTIVGRLGRSLPSAMAERRRALGAY